MYRTGTRVRVRKTIGKHGEVAEEPLYMYISEGMMHVAARYRGTPGAKFTKFVE